MESWKLNKVYKSTFVLWGAVVSFLGLQSAVLAFLDALQDNTPRALPYSFKGTVARDILVCFFNISFISPTLIWSFLILNFFVLVKCKSADSIFSSS